MTAVEVERMSARKGLAGRGYSRGHRAALTVFCTGLLALSAPLQGLEAQWLEEPGQGWAEVTFIYHDTDQVFDQRGAERFIFADGRAITRSIFLTAVTGIHTGLDTWVQVPIHSITFNDAGSDLSNTGFGDPSIYLRVGTGILEGIPDVPLALRGGVKLAGGSFDVDSEVIPLGEGQTDWELLAELGHSFHPLPFWTVAWVGHRWRTENTDAVREPGDEWFWLWSVGGDAGPVEWTLTLDGLEGGTWTIEGLEVPTARRYLTQGLFELGRPIGPGTLSAGVRNAFRGRNLPSGTAWTLSYFVNFGGF